LWPTGGPSSNSPTRPASPFAPWDGPSTATPHPPPDSTAAIIDALDQLRFEDPGDGAAAVWARNRAAQAGWDPATPAPDRADIDDVAVARVVDGSVIPLRPAEQQAALQRLAGHYSDDEIARRLGLASRTVLRHRKRDSLPAYATQSPPKGPTR